MLTAWVVRLVIWGLAMVVTAKQIALIALEHQELVIAPLNVHQAIFVVEVIALVQQVVHQVGNALVLRIETTNIPIVVGMVAVLMNIAHTVVLEMAFVMMLLLHQYHPAGHVLIHIIIRGVMIITVMMAVVKILTMGIAIAAMIADKTENPVQIIMAV